MIEIPESGVTFGPFEENSIYQIESSKNLPSHVKPVEFAWLAPRGNKLVLVEAKSSFSKPGSEQDFHKNLEEIYTKLVDSLAVLVASELRRHPNIYEELPERFKNLSWHNLEVHMRLVIPSFEKSWLAPISDELRKRLKHVLASFGISELNFQVLNQELALQQGLIKP